jgi:hypothetical protein
MTVEELQVLHAELWTFRAEMDANTPWKTPPEMDALRFAVTEAGEAMDPWLRTRGGYARNYEKEEYVLAELADCAMMLMTALGPHHRYTERNTPERVDIERIVFLVAVALNDYMQGWSWWKETAEVALYQISDYLGMNLPYELGERMARIKAKHAPYTIHADGRLLREGE